MDELEFRRHAYSEPFSDDEAFLAALKEDDSRAEFVQDLRNLDKKLEAALRVPVPEDLAEKLILRQNLQEHQVQKKRQRWHLAMAASIAFAIGLSFTLFNQAPKTLNFDLGEHTLARTAFHAGNMGSVEPVSLEAVNVKLASFGGRFEQLPGNISSANFCDFGGIRTLHIVMPSGDDKIDVFILPYQNEMPLPEHFANKNYQGLGHHQGKMNFAIVGGKEKELESVMKEVTSKYQAI